MATMTTDYTGFYVTDSLICNILVFMEKGPFLAFLNKTKEKTKVFIIRNLNLNLFPSGKNIFVRIIPRQVPLYINVHCKLH